MSSTPEVRSLVLRDDLAALVEERPDARAPAGARVSGVSPVLRLDHLWVRPDLRGQGLGRVVLELLRQRVTGEGATVLSATVPRGDAAMTALSAGARVLGEHLLKPVDPDVADPGLVQHRPLTAAELVVWREAQILAYAHDNLARSGGDLARALERSRADFDRLLPDGLRTPDTSLVMLIAGDERIGHLWLRHHVEPGLSFVFDVEVAEEHRGRGFGRAAMVVADVLTRDAGDDRLGLHVFGGNAVALRLYLTQGYEALSTTYDLLARQDP